MNNKGSSTCPCCEGKGWIYERVGKQEPLNATKMLKTYAIHFFRGVYTKTQAQAWHERMGQLIDRLKEARVDGS